MLKRYRQLYEGRFQTFLEYMDTPLKKALRINTLKTSHIKIGEVLEKKGFSFTSVGDNVGFEINDGPYAISSIPEHLYGHFYIQGVAEMSIAPQLKCEKGDAVWDMCAAPGGKTTHISQLIKNTGVILATDVSSQKLQALRNNVARLGCTNTLIVKADARDINLPSKFDKIMLDAPCTGSGIVRKDPSRKSSRTIEDINFMSSLQKGLLEKAVSSIKREGKILYATCSLEPEENEMVINWAIDSLPVKLLPLDKGVMSPAFTSPFGKKLNDEIALCGRIHPHVADSNGMFMALIKKTGTS